MRYRALSAVVALIALAAIVAVLPQTNPAGAVQKAGQAAASLGFRLAELPTPRVSGSDLWGTRSFHWEIAREDGVRHLLAYLVSDNALCWTSVRGDAATNHGCIVVDQDRSS